MAGNQIQNLYLVRIQNLKWKVRMESYRYSNKLWQTKKKKKHGKNTDAVAKIEWKNC